MVRSSVCRSFSVGDDDDDDVATKALVLVAESSSSRRGRLRMSILAVLCAQ